MFSLFRDWRFFFLVKKKRLLFFHKQVSYFIAESLHCQAPRIFSYNLSPRWSFVKLLFPFSITLPVWIQHNGTGSRKFVNSVLCWSSESIPSLSSFLKSKFMWLFLLLCSCHVFMPSFLLSLSLLQNIQFYRVWRKNSKSPCL